MVLAIGLENPNHVGMNTHHATRTTGRALGLFGLGLGLLAVALLGGCGSGRPGGGSEGTVTSRVSSNVPLLDGDITDWPSDKVLAADANYLYFRFTVQDREFTLQRAPQSVVMFIDADGSASTGLRMGEPELSSLGIDLEIEFSPRTQEGVGVQVFEVRSDGSRSPIGANDAGVEFSPTYASVWYEGRIRRNTRVLAELPEGGMRSIGRAGAFFATLTPEATLDQYSDPSFVDLPRASATFESVRRDVRIPRQAANSVRVVSWNVLRSSPMSKPDVFKRMFDALNPDIILVQEWEVTDAQTLLDYFQRNTPLASGWHVFSTETDMGHGGGVAVISRYPLSGGPALLTTAPNSQAGRSADVRFISAVVSGTPCGEILVGSTHLKSGGSKGSPEDLRRMAEAEAINTAWKEFAAAGKAPKGRVIAGDMNLVGSRPPLEVLATGLDADGSELSMANAKVLGDNTLSTWYNKAESFTPGRLDYVLFSDSSLMVADSFVLDTRRLSDAALMGIGLDVSDSDASDHMPVVVDFVTRR